METQTNKGQEMTIHRALKELKTLAPRIKRALDDMTPIGLHQKDGKVFKRHTLDEFKVMAESSYKSAKDLIERRVTIKRLIVESNAKETVTVGGQTMKVADAIAMKTFIKDKQEFLVELEKHFQNSKAVFNKENEKVKDLANQLLTANVGKDASAEQIKNIYDPYIERNEVIFYDPLEVEKKIKTMRDEISTFLTEVDACLSEANAIHKIVVPD